MAQLNTIPAESAPLTAAPQSKTTLKGLVAGAALASFVLGMLAANAVTSQASRAPANLSAVDWQCRSSGGGSTGYSKWCPAQNECVRPWEVDYKADCEKTKTSRTM